MKTLLLLLIFLNSSSSQIKDIYLFGSKVNDYIANHFHSSDSIEINRAYLDSIFSFALKIADSNINDALLFCVIGTMTYPTFKIKIPVLGLLIPFKFFYWVDSVKFNQKIKNLPSKLFYNSPPSEFSDKDKVVHFFSTAYLSYMFGNNFSNHIGCFVEEFEESFKVDGKVDLRDLKINELGSKFGNTLRFKLIYPSIILAEVKEL